jgi:hypothetical protein
VLELDPVSLAHGFTEALQTTKDWLTPGQLRELCTGSMREQQATEAQQSWTSVLRYVSLFGENLDRMDDLTETTRLTLQLLGGTVWGGLRLVGRCENDKLDFMRKSFIDFYLATARRVG